MSAFHPGVLGEEGVGREAADVARWVFPTRKGYRFQGWSGLGLGVIEGAQMILPTLQLGAGIPYIVILVLFGFPIGLLLRPPGADSLVARRLALYESPAGPGNGGKGPSPGMG